MNNAKMWLVVKPTVGVPLFLSAVAIGSFAVHVAVLSNTTWVADFLSGNELGSSSVQTSSIINDTTKATGSTLASMPFQATSASRSFCQMAAQPLRSSKRMPRKCWHRTPSVPTENAFAAVPFMKMHRAFKNATRLF